jgi:hypothetical protein
MAKMAKENDKFFPTVVKSIIDDGDNLRQGQIQITSSTCETKSDGKTECNDPPPTIEILELSDDGAVET